ncbi:hypothetical protein WJX81_004055 [Elliptochloris bilobata]|uniref:Uncharacterized protein n=1 Tax=Elliptochloris bilobata TaxID=381761 RepID=A0AAW1QN52_9CHLO
MAGPVGGPSGPHAAQAGAAAVAAAAAALIVVSSASVVLPASSAEPALGALAAGRRVAVDRAWLESLLVEETRARLAAMTDSELLAAFELLMRGPAPAAPAAAAAPAPLPSWINPNPVPNGEREHALALQRGTANDGTSGSEGAALLRAGEAAVTAAAGAAATAAAAAGGLLRSALPELPWAELDATAAGVQSQLPIAAALGGVALLAIAFRRGASARGKSRTDALQQGPSAVEAQRGG